MTCLSFPTGGKGFFYIKNVIICMDICSYTYLFFPDVNNFIVGSEEGTVYTGTLIPLFSIYIALLCGYFEK